MHCSDQSKPFSRGSYRISNSGGGDLLPLGGSGACPPGHFGKMNALRLILRPFLVQWQKNRHTLYTLISISLIYLYMSPTIYYTHTLCEIKCKENQGLWFIQGEEDLKYINQWSERLASIPIISYHNIMYVVLTCLISHKPLSYHPPH